MVCPSLPYRLSRGYPPSNPPLLARLPRKMPRTTEGGGAVRWRMDGGRSNSLRRRLCARRDRQTAVRRVLSRDVGVLGDRRSCGGSPLDRGCSLTPSHARARCRRLSYLAHFFPPWGPSSFLALLRPSQLLRSLLFQLVCRRRIEVTRPPAPAPSARARPPRESAPSAAVAAAAGERRRCTVR